MFTQPLHTLDPVFRPAFAELLKPYVEACGFSTLTQCRSLQMHQQVESRLKLLYEIQVDRLRHFEMIGDDFYLDDYQVSNSFAVDYLEDCSKLADEIAEVESVRHQLDIHNTIDHVPVGDGEWWLFHDEKVSTYWRKLVTARPLKAIREDYGHTKVPAFKDEASLYLEKSTMLSRRSFTVQRILNALRQAHLDRRFLVFDTLTLADDRLQAFYDNPNALRDHFRKIGRLVLEAEGKSQNGTFKDCFEYFCVPEYGSREGRLHFHVIYIMRTNHVSAKR